MTEAREYIKRVMDEEWRAKVGVERRGDIPFTIPTGFAEQAIDAAVADTERRIVEWLRGKNDWNRATIHAGAAFADALERGDHRKAIEEG